MSKFNIGDKVLVTYDYYRLVNERGTIVGNDGPLYFVRFDDPSTEGETNPGKYPGKNGVGCFEERLTLVPKQTFKNGDRVSVTYSTFGLKDAVGTIMFYDSEWEGGRYAVEFDEPCYEFHNCNGKTKSGRGLWVGQEPSVVKLIERKEEKKVSKLKFNIGDRVKVCSRHYLAGKIGTVAGFQERNSLYLVSLDGYERGHNGEGMIATNSGTWVKEEQIEKIEVEIMGKGKFAVGDRVMIKYMTDLRADYPGIRDDGTSLMPEMLSPMMDMAGKFYEIQDISEHDNPLINGWYFDPRAVMLVEKKVVPKKKITVAEIEKALGYGVEIIKEGK